VGGTPVGELAKSLKPGGAMVVDALLSGQFPAMPPSEFISRGLSLHGFWLITWIRHAPRAEIREMSQKLGDLVAEGSLRAAVEQVYPLDAFQEAFTQSLQSQRSGKILFTCGAPDGVMPAKEPATTTPSAFREHRSKTWRSPVQGCGQRVHGLAWRSSTHGAARHAPRTRDTLHGAYAGAREHGSSAEAQDELSLPM
jgi:hypothetical protein